MEKTTARARTRGKNPQEFTFEGYGVAVEREVKGKDGKGLGIFVDELDVKGLVYNEDGSVKETALDDVLAIHDGQIGKLIEAAFNAANTDLRKAASPVTETDTDDELTPIIDVLIAGGFLSRARVIEGKEEPLDEVRNWRRTVTTGAKGIDMDTVTYARLTREYKAAVKAGATFPTE